MTKLTATGTVAYSTYLGGDGYDSSYGIALDSAGSAFVPGYTTTCHLATRGAFDTTYDGYGYHDAFVTKVTSDGALAYFTYLGGAGWESGYRIEVDTAGNAYLTGDTSSPDFPTVHASDDQLGGQDDAFVTKLGPRAGPCAAPPEPGTLPGNTIVVRETGVTTVGTPGDDVIYGTAGDDRIAGAGGDDTIFAMAGNDSLSGGGGRDSLCGGEGDYKLSGGPGDDHLSGGEGHDDLSGDGDDDTLSGGGGRDDLAGGGGDDELLGGSGADHLVAGPGADTCAPGGEDTDAPASGCDVVQR